MRFNQSKFNQIIQCAVIYSSVPSAKFAVTPGRWVFTQFKSKRCFDHGDLWGRWWNARVARLCGVNCIHFSTSWSLQAWWICKVFTTHLTALNLWFAGNGFNVVRLAQASTIKEKRKSGNSFSYNSERRE